MAAPGGPDAETWAKMSRAERAVYTVVIGVLVAAIAVAFVFY
jgi:hypothetical protein